MSLTNDQQKALQKINSFLENDDSRHFLIEGPAGVGKTYIMRFLNPQFEFKYFAPTHKASAVLRNKINERVQTIDTLLGNKMEYNEEGELKLIKGTPQQYPKHTILVIDEASMINKESFESLMKLKNKIIFLGDSYQLPPIGEQKSEVFKNKDKSIMKEQCRAKSNSSIAKIFNVFRNVQEKSFNFNKFTFKDKIKLNKCVKDKTLSEYKFREKIEKYLIQKKDFAIICFTNRKVEEYNNLCINILQGIRKKKDPYLIGMKMILLKTMLYSKDEEITDNNYYFSMETYTKNTYLYSCTVYTITNCIEITQELTRGNEVVFAARVYKLTVEDIDDKEIYTFYKIHEKDKEKFNRFFRKERESTKQIAKSCGGVKKTIQDLWSKYWLDRNKFECNITPFYAITSHKSQGSTIPYVLVDISNILSVRMSTDETKCKSMYVGISRANKSIWLKM